jgi:hypothetical protein
MIDQTPHGRIIPAKSVQHSDAPVLVDCQTTADGRLNTIAVVPLAEAGAILGFEVRCQCGAEVIVECVYEEGPR